MHSLFFSSPISRRLSAWPATFHFSPILPRVLLPPASSSCSSPVRYFSASLSLSPRCCTLVTLWFNLCQIRRSSSRTSFFLLTAVVLVDWYRDDGLVAGATLAQLCQRPVVVDVADRRRRLLLLLLWLRRRVLVVLERRRQRLGVGYRSHWRDDGVLALYRLYRARVTTHAWFADVERHHGALARHRRRQQRVVAAAASSSIAAPSVNAVRRTATPVDLADCRRTKLRLATSVRHVGVPLRFARTDTDNVSNNIVTRKSHTGFRLVHRVVTLNDPELRNRHYFTSFHPQCGGFRSQLRWINWS